MTHLEWEILAAWGASAIWAESKIKEARAAHAETKALVKLLWERVETAESTIKSGQDNIWDAVHEIRAEVRDRSRPFLP